MKSPAGQPRARRPVPKRPVQLNLRRTPTWPEEDELHEPRGNFWTWFAIIFLVHVVGLVVLLILFHSRTPKPPEAFMEVFQPPGDVAKGTAGQQAAHKISPTTPAPSHPVVATPVPPPPTPVKPEPVKPKVEQVIPPTPKPAPPPIIKDEASEQAPPVKPPTPKPVKVEPPKPKIKVDLSRLVDAPTDDQPPPKIKPKVHPKKIVKPAQARPDAAAETESETSGLSPAEVARRIGDKLRAAGVEQGRTDGPNGSTHSTASDFADFYQSIHDQVMNKWSEPNLVDETAIDPVVQIHIEKNGRVPAGLVKLLRSSNNPAFDQSALEAARAMGRTLQPLPDGCPPDISITFNLRQQ
jgi:TonB family protein